MIRYFAILLLFIALTTQAQQQFLKVDEVAFKTPTEARIIREVLQGESPEFHGFLAVASEDSIHFKSWKDRFDHQVLELKNRKKSRKLVKDIRFIYDEVHDRFLRKYVNTVFFDHLFEEGVYNCVTAVALYGLAFQELDIPYVIKETPTHVYLIADPEGESLFIETTDPVSGFKTFTPEFRENFVAELRKAKLVDQADIDAHGILNVFEQHYFGGESLTLFELIGVQYFNEGIKLLEQQDYFGAWDAFSKAQLFHGGEDTHKMLYSSLTLILSHARYADWDEIRMLPLAERFLSFDISEITIIGEFYRMLNHNLISGNDPELAQRGYEYFMAHSSHADIKKEVAFLYHHEHAVIEYNRANYQRAFAFIKEAYLLKPGHARVENLLRESFMRSSASKAPQEVLLDIDTLLATYPRLNENNQFHLWRLHLCLQSMGESFENKKPVAGQEFLDKFLSLKEEKPDLQYDNNMVGYAFSRAATYYFRKGHTSRARIALKKGLELVPDNYELRTKLRMIDQ